MTGWIHEKGLPSGKYALDVGQYSVAIGYIR